MKQPCSLNSLGWEMGANCPRCGHTGWMHPGGGGVLAACVICTLLMRTVDDG